MAGGTQPSVANSCRATLRTWASDRASRLFESFQVTWARQCTGQAPAQKHACSTCSACMDAQYNDHHHHHHAAHGSMCKALGSQQVLRTQYSFCSACGVSWVYINTEYSPTCVPQLEN